MSGKFNVIGILDDWKKGDLPGNQMVNVVLNDHFTIRNRYVALTAQLASDEEVDFAIDKLIKDLEVVRVKAKKSIVTINEKIRNSLAEKYI
ncbi:MAG: hypothetical protein WC733_04525 [Methylophilus sp.]|jgi:hypothetical protein